MRLLPLLIPVLHGSTIYELIPDTNRYRFKTGTDFYKKYEKNIIRGAADCMQSSQFTLNNGDTKTFPGIYWPDQKGGSNVIDKGFEKQWLSRIFRIFRNTKSSFWASLREKVETMEPIKNKYLVLHMTD